MAIAILTRFQATSEYALDILSLYPWQYEQAHDAMQNMLNEKHLVRAAILDENGKSKLGIGFQEQAPWPDFKKTAILLARFWIKIIIFMQSK